MKNYKMKPVIAMVAMILVIAVCGLICFNLGYANGIPDKSNVKTSLKQYFCFHSWNDGACTKCGVVCKHAELDDDFNCKTCGMQHTHSYQNGICTECGYKCPHAEWTDDGYCKECGARCAHVTWDGDSCATCGIKCDHPSFENGICTICGYSCPHNFADGICTLCGMACQHPAHDADTAICNVCGLQTVHKYVDGQCSCGKLPPFTSAYLEETLLNETDEQGTIQEIYYTAPKYTSGDDVTMERSMTVYLPYGYSADKQYDVLIMVHGEYGSATDWMTAQITANGIYTQPSFLYDNLIEQHIINPLIIVAVNTYEGSVDLGYKQISPEIRNVIIPYIVDNFATYAKSSSLEDIQAARSHFGIGGDSNGALYAYNSGMCDNMDIFSTFICLGACASPEDYAAAINNYTDMDIDCYFAGTGSNDTQYTNTTNGFTTIVSNTDKLENNVNAFYTSIYNGSHDFSTWLADAYNGLLVAFPHTGASEKTAEIVTDTEETSEDNQETDGNTEETSEDNQETDSNVQAADGVEDYRSDPSAESITITYIEKYDGVIDTVRKVMYTKGDRIYLESSQVKSFNENYCSYGWTESPDAALASFAQKGCITAETDMTLYSVIAWG